MDELVLLLNSFYLFLIINVVNKSLGSIRPLYIQILSIIVSTLIIYLLPFNIMTIILSFISFILIAYPIQYVLKAALYSFLVASLIGGMLFVVADYWPTAFVSQWLAFIILTFICYVYFIRRFFKWKGSILQSQYVRDVHFQFSKYEITLKGFIDTGNSSVEPISKKPVHFVKLHALKHEQYGNFISCMNAMQMKDFEKVQSIDPNLQQSIRYIPTTTIHKGQSLLIGIKGTVQIDEHNLSPCYIVFLDERGYFPHQCSALLHVSMIT